jgi:hypothetical protein
MASYSANIAVFVASKICSNGIHIKPAHYFCEKHIPIYYICRLCKMNSKYLFYCYKCDSCNQLYCTSHFLLHQTYINKGSKLSKRWGCTSNYITINPDLCNVFSSQQCKGLAEHIVSDELNIYGDAHTQLNNRYFKQIISGIRHISKLSRFIMRSYISRSQQR